MIRTRLTALTTLLTAAAPAARSEEARLGHLAPVGDPRHEVMTTFAEAVEMLAFERDPRILTSTTTPARAVEDLQGMMVRVPDVNSHTDTWRALGVEPVPMPAPDFCLALRLDTMVCDAALAPAVE